MVTSIKMCSKSEMHSVISFMHSNGHSPTEFHGEIVLNYGKDVMRKR